MAAGDAPIDAEAVAEVVSRCPSVVKLTPGPGVERVTYLPGRRVPGVRMGDAGLEVHVVARYGPTMPEVAAEIRTALLPLLGGAPVSVVIQDVDVEVDDVGPATEPRAAAW